MLPGIWAAPPASVSRVNAGGVLNQDRWELLGNFIKHEGRLSSWEWVPSLDVCSGIGICLRYPLCTKLPRMLPSWRIVVVLKIVVVKDGAGPQFNILRED